MTERLVDAFVSGIYAGNISEISFAAAFPRLYEQMLKHRSLFRAMPAMAHPLRSRAARRRLRGAGAGRSRWKVVSGHFPWPWLLVSETACRWASRPP